MIKFNTIFLTLHIRLNVIIVPKVAKYHLKRSFIAISSLSFVCSSNLFSGFKMSNHKFQILF